MPSPRSVVRSLPVVAALAIITGELIFRLATVAAAHAVTIPAPVAATPPAIELPMAAGEAASMEPGVAEQELASSPPPSKKKR